MNNQTWLNNCQDLLLGPNPWVDTSILKTYSYLDDHKPPKLTCKIIFVFDLNDTSFNYLPLLDPSFINHLRASFNINSKYTINIDHNVPASQAVINESSNDKKFTVLEILIGLAPYAAIAMKDDHWALVADYLRELLSK